MRKSGGAKSDYNFTYICEESELGFDPFPLIGVCLASLKIGMLGSKLAIA